MRVRFTLPALSLLALVSGLSTVAQADAIPYPNVGTEAPPNVFTGMGGDVNAYFYGYSGAAYYEQLGMYVNGTLTSAGYVFPNHDTAPGGPLDLGAAPAGSNIVFSIQVWASPDSGNFPTNLGTAAVDGHYNGTPDYVLYSTPSLNPDGINHAYATHYTAGTNPAIPVDGTYVGFEDLLASVPPDFNYQDEQFVFTNIGQSSVPEPGTIALLVASGLSGAAFLRRRKGHTVHHEKRGLCPYE